MQDGKRVKVDWQTPFLYDRSWYFFRNSRSIQKINPGTWKNDALIAFVFDDKPQPIEKFLKEPNIIKKYGPPNITIGNNNEEKPVEPENNHQDDIAKSCIAQNIILYGPPGTGKTYDTKRQALNLLLGKDSVNAITQEDIAEKFREYQEKGQLEFVTFHQSYGYEDFIEGLRPILGDTGNKDVRYEMHDGIFKRIALRAAFEGLSKTTNELDFEYLWALLVEDIRENEDIIVQSKSGTEYVLRLYGQNNVEAMRCEKNAEGDYEILGTKLLASKKNSKKLWENFNEHPNEFTSKISYDIVKTGHHYTALWIIYKKLFEISKGKNISDSSQIDNVAREEQAKSALGQDNSSFKFSSDSQQYVLIIDEINRGNISKILGELMTLLEPDKRLGAANELRLPLAYSPESRFGVPPNLHILGTMNTADRSIALMDVALRRRFTFKEVMPDKDCLEEILTEKLGDGSPLVPLIVDLFEVLNERIRFLYDRDHQIGHAYFLGVKTLEDLRLVFADRVIPLLQEYFYDDWNKICIVLGCPYGDNGKPKREASHLKENGTYRAPIIQARRFSEKDTLGFDHEDYEDRVDFSIMPHFQSGPMEKNDLARTFLGVLQLEENDFKKYLKELTPSEASPNTEENDADEETTTDAS